MKKLELGHFCSNCGEKCTGCVEGDTLRAWAKEKAEQLGKTYNNEGLRGIDYFIRDVQEVRRELLELAENKANTAMTFSWRLPTEEEALKKIVCNRCGINKFDFEKQYAEKYAEKSVIIHKVEDAIFTMRVKKGIRHTTAVTVCNDCLQDMMRGVDTRG